MTEKDTREMQAALAKPFAPEDLEWRLQNTIEETMRGMAVPYVTNRAIQNRLDEVCGPENWYNEFKPWHSNGKKDSQLCGIAIHFEGKGFITKWDGAEDSDIEPIKGGLSDSMKRSAVQWGIGRVLYKMTKPLWVKIEQKGNSYVICDTERPKLNAAYLELLDTHKQKTMEQFVHLRGNGLFLGIVCIVLLPDRRAGLETVDFFLPRNRVEFHHDLSGATNRRVRRHCEFLFRRGGFPLSRSDSTGDQQRRLCRHMLAVSLFSLPKKHILESLTHLKWPAVSSNTSQRSSAEISIKANYTGDWEILSSALRLIQNHKTNQKVKVLN